VQAGPDNAEGITGSFYFTRRTVHYICSVGVPDSALKLTYQLVHPRAVIKFNSRLIKEQPQAFTQLALLDEFRGWGSCDWLHRDNPDV
jgi:hypothetical protein